EDGLHLIGARVTHGDVGAAGHGQVRGGTVALIAGPGLEVAAPGRPAPTHPHRAPDVELDAQRLAHRRAVALVGVRGGAQPVVDVQGADRGRSGDLRREIEQAGGVAPAGVHDHHGPALGQQPLGPDGLHQVAHSGSSRRWRATNTSVDSLKPLSVTSPMRSKSRWFPPTLATSTTGRVTSTSPPAERAATRLAMLMSRP